LVPASLGERKKKGQQPILHLQRIVETGTTRKRGGLSSLGRNQNKNNSSQPIKDNDEATQRRMAKRTGEISEEDDASPAIPT